MATSTIKRTYDIQCGQVSQSLPVGQSEITVNLPRNYSGGNAYVVLCTMRWYGVPAYLQAPLVRSQFANYFVVRVTNNYTAEITDAALQWMTIGIPT